ncbi:MAG TPA: hypothetical protein VJT75_06470 [Thermoleophilaceae bacterium]|nr:hypothetical protein [Thermoleophilaceae bacterium]
MVGTRICRQRLSAMLALAVFSAAPFLVFQHTVRDAATDFRVEFNYLVTGWAPWLLIVLGTLCFVPVVVSMNRSAFSRWSLAPGIRHAYEVWGAVLYLLGVLLLTQTSQVAGAF